MTLKHVFLCLLLLTLPSLCVAEELSKAPQFTLKSFHHKQTSLDQYLDKGPVIISFWASWCGPCIAELVSLKPYYSDLKKKGVTVLAISIDQPKDISKVKRLVKKYKFKYKILLDSDQKVFKRFQGKYPPLTVLIDQEGTIRYRHNRYQKGDELTLMKEVRKLLYKKTTKKKGK